jgi:cell wall assembly regulator SMI1
MRCIKAWAAVHLPEMLPTLCPGLTPQQLKDLQQQWGVTLPQGLQILYRCAGGVGGL